VYVGLVDPNTSSFYPGCPFRAMTGFDCPGCGATRALHAAITGHPLQALDHNAFFVVAAVLGIVGFVTTKLRRRIGRPAIAWKLSASGAIALGLLTCTFWIARNMLWEPLSWFGSGISGGR
jgi:CHASE2 domain-containing sensor protein